MHNIVGFNQPAGIGDIFFLLKIANVLAENGYSVIWPLDPNVFFVKEHLIVHENVKFVLPSSDLPRCHVFDFQNADRFFPEGSLLVAKYLLASASGVPVVHSGWQDHLKFSRNKEKEDRLFYDVLKLTDGERYAFYNRNYGTPPQFKQKKNMHISPLRHVEMFISDEFSLFDWLKVVETAEEIHVIDSSLTYLIDVLNMSAKDDKMHLYSRYKEERGNALWFHAADLFKRSWIYEEI